jgi:hypothetical protein
MKGEKDWINCFYKLECLLLIVRYCEDTQGWFQGFLFYDFLVFSWENRKMKVLLFEMWYTTGGAYREKNIKHGEFFILFNLLPS